MPQYRISNPARADIVDILRLSQTQFGYQARQRYQALIVAALNASGLCTPEIKAGAKRLSDFFSKQL